MKLRPRRFDELEARHAQAAQRSPAELPRRVVGGRPQGAGRPVRPVPQQARAVAAGVGGQAAQLQHRRCDVGQRHVPPADLARRQAIGQPQDQRHAQRGVVEQDAVGLLAVLAQALPVVGRQDDQRVGARAPGWPARAAGGRPGCPRTPLRRRRGRRRSAARRAPGPRAGRARRRGATSRKNGLWRGRRSHSSAPSTRPRASLTPWKRALRLVHVGGAVVVQAEAAVEAEDAVEHVRGHERGRVVAGPGEPLGQRRRSQVARRHAVVDQPVRGGLQPRQQRGVRGKRQRHRGVGPAEEQARAGQAVDGGRSPRQPGRSSPAGRRAACRSSPAGRSGAAGAARTPPGRQPLHRPTPAPRPRPSHATARAILPSRGRAAERAAPLGRSAPGSSPLTKPGRRFRGPWAGRLAAEGGANSGMFAMTPFTRHWPGECGSGMARSARLPEEIWHQTWAQPRKKRCSGREAVAVAALAAGERFRAAPRRPCAGRRCRRCSRPSVSCRSR